MSQNKKRTAGKQQLLWWLIAVVWIGADGVLFAAGNYHRSSAVLALASAAMLIVPFLLAFHVPPGMFRAVRSGSTAAKIGLGLLILSAGAPGSMLIANLILSRFGPF